MPTLLLILLRNWYVFLLLYFRLQICFLHFHFLILISLLTPYFFNYVLAIFALSSVYKDNNFCSYPHPSCSAIWNNSRPTIQNIADNIRPAIRNIDRASIQIDRRASFKIDRCASIKINRCASPSTIFDIHHANVKINHRTSSSTIW